MVVILSLSLSLSQVTGTFGQSLHETLAWIQDLSSLSPEFDGGTQVMEAVKVF